MDISTNNPRPGPPWGAIRSWLCLAALAGAPLAGIGQLADEPYAFTTFAGWSNIGAENGPAAQARFFRPNGLAIDSADNLYVADTYNQVIRKIAPDGTVSILAGGLGQPGSADGPNLTARFLAPFGVAVDSANAVFVADAGNSSFRKIAGGSVTTLATDVLQKTFGPINPLSIEADPSLYGPRGDFLAALAVDRSGNVVGKYSMSALGGAPGFLKLTPGGSLQLVNIPPPSGVLFGIYISGAPTVAVDSSNNILGTDPYWTQIFLPNHAPEIGGQGWLLSTVDQGGATTASSTSDRRPVVWADPAGTVIVADVDYGSTSPRGRLVVTVTSPAGAVSTVTSIDILDSASQPITGVVRNRAGDFFFLGQHAVFKMTATGAVSVLAGVPRNASLVRRDGQGTAARFARPIAIATDRSGNVYVNDGALRRISPAGAVTTLIAPAVPDFPEGSGNPTMVIQPDLLAVDDAGNVYFIDPYWSNGSPALRKRAPDGSLSTILDPTTGVGVPWSTQMAMTVDHTGIVYLASHYSIYKVSSPGSVSLFAGSTSIVGSGYAEGQGTAARFSVIFGLAVDAANNVLVADAGNRRIRRITPGGLVSTIPGGENFATLDGTPDQTGRAWAGHLTADDQGNIFVAGGDNTIRKITPGGAVTLLAGAGPVQNNVDGVGRAVRFLYCTGIALDGSGNLYVTDGYSNTIRKGQRAGPPVITTQPQGLTAMAGNSVQLSVAASGMPAPTYQWQFNGGAIGGATASSLSLTGVQASNAGDYTVVVTNEVGSVTSSKATLAVSAGPAQGSSGGAGSAGGGGAIGPWLAAALLALGAARYRIRRL